MDMVLENPIKGVESLFLVNANLYTVSANPIKGVESDQVVRDQGVPEGIPLRELKVGS